MKLRPLENGQKWLKIAKWHQNRSFRRPVAQQPVGQIVSSKYVLSNIFHALSYGDLSYFSNPRLLKIACPGKQRMVSSSGKFE